MALHATSWNDAYRIAMAAAADAASSQMRRAGRSTWDQSDYDVVGEQFAQIMRAMGFGPSPVHPVEDWATL